MQYDPHHLIPGDEDAFGIEDRVPYGTREIEHFDENLLAGNTNPCPLEKVEVPDAALEAYKPSHPRGFVFSPTASEILALSSDDPNSLRHAETTLIDLHDFTNELRGREIIPNLVRQLRHMRDRLHLEKKTRIIFQDHHDMGGVWIVVFELADHGKAVVKHYIKLGSRLMFEAKLTAEGELLLPKFPPGAVMAVMSETL